jgi:hypothetical protein
MTEYDSHPILILPRTSFEVLKSTAGLGLVETTTPKYAFNSAGGTWLKTDVD